MKLWTVQADDARQQLIKDGMLVGSWDRIDDSMFESAYRWLVKQMIKRGLMDSDKHPPVWAWSTKPEPGTVEEWSAPESKDSFVLMEIEVPDNKVLVTNFDAWHCVLNDGFCSFTDEEMDNYFDRDLYSRQDIEDSWQRIFDLDGCKKAGWGSHHQVVFQQLAAPQLISVCQPGALTTV